MKTKHILLLVSIVALCSCSSAFRNVQTPDDVYYSPAPPPPVEYVTTENQQDRDSYANHNDYNSEDLAIRRGISDPRYRSNISLDMGYGYSPFDYYGSSLYSPYSSFYNPYTSYYNPYSYTGVTFFPHGYNYNYYGSYSPYSNYLSPFNSYYPPVYVSPTANYSAGPRTFNLGAYNNNTRSAGATVSQQQSTTGTTMPVRTVAPRATTGTGVGNLIRRVISPSDNNRSYNRSDNDNNRSYRNDNYNNNNNNSAPTRTIQPNTSSSSSSSSSSGSSSAPVRTFR